MSSRPLIRASRSRKPSRWLPEAMRLSVSRSIAMLRGGLVMAMAAMFALMLLSYDHGDPSWNTAAPAARDIHNWLGAFGSHGADLVWQFFGLGGWLIAVILAAWGWRMIGGGGLGLLPWRAVAALLALLACGIGLTALAPRAAVTSILWGGAFGKLLGADLLHALPRSWGGYAVMGGMAAITLGLLYMACALTLGEWHHLLKT